MRKKESAVLELQALQQKLDQLTQLSRSLEGTRLEPTVEPYQRVVSGFWDGQECSAWAYPTKSSHAVGPSREAEAAIPVWKPGTTDNTQILKVLP